MIVFLTLIYVAVLFLALKIGIIKMNTFWKISPGLWMVLLFFVLFVPMQWGAPAGTVRLYQSVIEVIPNVNGEVIEVPVRPLEEVWEGDTLFVIDPAQYESKVHQLETQIALAQANLARAQDLMDRGVGRQVDVDIYQTETNALKAQLENAHWELEKTVVRAPAHGRVVALTLRPGQRVANLPLRSWMAFVEEDSKRLAVGISQARMRYIQLGQEVEVALRFYPGRVLSGKVVNYVGVNASAQLAPSGLLPMAPVPSDPFHPFGVIVELDDESIDLYELPGGAQGTATIYTESVQATHIIRRVMMRMEAWMNYLKP